MVSHFAADEERGRDEEVGRVDAVGRWYNLKGRLKRKMTESVNQSKFAIFQNADGEPTVAARFENDDVWLTQKHLALLYKTTK